jgi:hypothetical protein
VRRDTWLATGLWALGLGALAGLAGGCQSEGLNLNAAVHDLMGDVDRLLGAKSPPGRHLAVLRDVHESKSWTFSPEASDPLGKTRKAVRGLSESDYATWGEAALVVQVLSSMADEHTSALVRVEALDALTALAPWTLEAALPPGRAVTEPEVISALRVVKEARERSDQDAAFAFDVAQAVDTLGAYRYEQGRDLPADAGPATVAREHGSRLKTARGVLLAFTGSTLEGFQADPTVREALDRAHVNVASSVIGLTLTKAALGDPAETVRTTAVRAMERVRLDGAAPVLRLVVAHDPATSVRREAAAALGRWPPADAVPALIPALADDMAEVRSAAARSLREATGESHSDDRAAWTRWWLAQGARADHEADRDAENEADHQAGAKAQ